MTLIVPKNAFLMALVVGVTHGPKKSKEFAITFE